MNESTNAGSAKKEHTLQSTFFQYMFWWAGASVALFFLSVFVAAALRAYPWLSGGRLSARWELTYGLAILMAVALAAYMVLLVQAEICLLVLTGRASVRGVIRLFLRPFKAASEARESLRHADVRTAIPRWVFWLLVLEHVLLGYLILRFFLFGSLSPFRQPPT